MKVSNLKVELFHVEKGERINDQMYKYLPFQVADLIADIFDDNDNIKIAVINSDQMKVLEDHSSEELFEELMSVVKFLSKDYIIVTRVGISDEIYSGYDTEISQEELDMNIIKKYLDHGFKYFNNIVKYEDGHSMIYGEAPNALKDFESVKDYIDDTIHCYTSEMIQKFIETYLKGKFNIINIVKESGYFSLLIERVSNLDCPNPRAEIHITTRGDIAIDDDFYALNVHNFYASFGSYVAQ